MTILSSTAQLIVEQGSPIVTIDTVTFLGIASAGDRSAKRRIVHPDSLLAPITYWGNPLRTLGLDNDVLFHPIVKPTRTLGTTAVERFETAIDDVVVTEIWKGGDAELSMPTFFFRQLYEYIINRPVFVAAAPVYIQWQPRDRNAIVYNVELLSLQVGGQGPPGGEADFDVIDVRPRGGIYDGGTRSAPFDDLNLTETGAIDREVRLRMKIVSKAA